MFPTGYIFGQHFFIGCSWAVNIQKRKLFCWPGDSYLFGHVCIFLVFKEKAFLILTVTCE